MIAIAAELLGGRTDIVFASGNEGTADPTPAPEPTRAPDKDDLLREGNDAADPTSMVVDLLGGEVVSE